MSRVVVDVGKSGVRARIEGADDTWTFAAPAVGRAGAPDAAGELATSLLAGLRARPTGDADPVECLTIGSTFMPPDPALPELVTLLRADHPGLGIALSDDGILAHAGCLGGPGVLVSVGTGVIVTLFGHDGSHRRVDGWGPDLGDRGSAFDIGRAGLRAVYAAADGAGDPTALTERFEAYLGRRPTYDTARWLMAEPARVEVIAGFGRHVTEAAGEDAVAATIIDRAAAELVRSITAVVRGEQGLPVAVSGRIAQAPSLASALEAALASAGLARVTGRRTMDATWDVVTAPPYAATLALLAPTAVA